MKTLQINLATAKKLYPTASTEIKDLLESTFSVAELSNKITDRVKTFEDALKEKDGAFLFPTVPGETEDELAYRKIKLITAVLNEGWVPDYSDEDQYKYYPWFEFSKSASAFQFYITDYIDTSAIAGSGVRLCFQSRELAEYAGKQFIDIYNKILNF